MKILPGSFLIIVVRCVTLELFIEELDNKRSKRFVIRFKWIIPDASGFFCYTQVTVNQGGIRMSKKMKVGCFALVDPFSPLEHQLKRISEMGFSCADITDSHPGGLLGGGIFDAAVSLDDNPFDIKRLFDKYGLEISSMAAHARLSDPSSPAKFGTSEIMKCIKLAATIDVPYVITTELEPETEWGKKRTHDQMVIIVADKLIEPLRLAEDMASNSSWSRTVR